MQPCAQAENQYGYDCLAVAWYLTWPPWLLGLGAFYGAVSLDWEPSRVWAITILVHIAASVARFRMLHGTRFRNVRVLIGDASIETRPPDRSIWHAWLRSAGAVYLVVALLYSLGVVLDWRPPSGLLSMYFVWPLTTPFAIGWRLVATLRTGSAGMRIERVP